MPASVSIKSFLAFVGRHLFFREPSQSTPVKVPGLRQALTTARLLKDHTGMLAVQLGRTDEFDARQPGSPSFMLPRLPIVRPRRRAHREPR
jgi:hypothetical protein